MTLQRAIKNWAKNLADSFWIWKRVREGLNGKSRVALVQSFFNLPLFRFVPKRVNQISALFWPTCFRGGGLVVASRALPGTLRVTGPAAKPSHKLVWGYTNRLWHLPSEGLFCCRSSSKMSLASTKSNVIGIISVRSSMSGSKSNDRTQSSLRLAYFRAEVQAGCATRRRVKHLMCKGALERMLWLCLGLIQPYAGPHTLEQVRQKRYSGRGEAFVGLTWADET